MMKKMTFLNILLLIMPYFAFAQKSKPFIITDDIELHVEIPEMISHKVFASKITITNKGNQTAKSVQVVEMIPSQIEYLASEPIGVRAKNNKKGLSKISWSFANIEPQEKKTITLKLKAKNQGYCTHKVKLFARINSSKIAIAEVATKHKIISYGSGVTDYDTEDPVAVGEKTTYVIEPRNEGLKPATKFWLVNQIPQEMVFVSAKGPTKYWYDPKKKVVIFSPVLVLKPGEKLVYHITCKAVKTGNAVNRAAIYYDQFSKAIVTEEGTSIYE